MYGWKRVRMLSVWLVFLFAAAASIIAIFRLYRTATEEIRAQGEHTLRQAREEFAQRVQRATDEARYSTIRDLASFHVDGLAQTMQKWDEAHAAVIGTFRWDATTGFSADSIFPAGAPPRETLVQLWQSFRAWRTQYPHATQWEGPKPEHFQIDNYRMDNNPLFPAADLGYQNENLDILSYAHRPTDPWAGWAGREDDTSVPWVFWYQCGPDDQIRGCFFDYRLIVQKVRIQAADTDVARVLLLPVGTSGVGEAAHAYAGDVGGLPGYRLYLDHGILFEKKTSSARFVASIAAGVFAMFFLGGVVLALHTRRQAREAERKVTFTTQVSHELRTPLTSIRMYADLLAQFDVTEGKRMKFAQTIGRESTRLETLIERLLSFNSLTKNDKIIARGPVDITSLVREVLEEMSAALHAAKLEVQTTLPADPMIAQTDYTIVKQALLNLLDNACKYAGEGSCVAISLHRSHEEILLDVADNGPGIPREIRHRLFEPFVQGGITLTDKSPGVGLGLSLARGTLRKVGGEVKLLEAAQGALFRISLPAGKSSTVSIA